MCTENEIDTTYVYQNAFEALSDFTSVGYPDGFVELAEVLQATMGDSCPCEVVNSSAGLLYVSSDIWCCAHAAFFPISTFVDAGFAAAFVRDGQVYMRTEDIRVGEEGLLWEFDPTGILPSGNYTLNVRAWCVVQGAGIAYSLASCGLYLIGVDLTGSSG